MQNLLIFKPQFIPLFFGLALANFLLFIFFMDVMTVFLYFVIFVPLALGIISIFINLYKKRSHSS